MASTAIRMSGPGYDLAFDIEEDADSVRTAAGKLVHVNVNAIDQFDRVVEQARGALIAAIEIQKRQNA